MFDIVSQLTALLWLLQLILALGVAGITFLIVRKFVGIFAEDYKNEIGGIAGLLMFYFAYTYWFANLLLIGLSVIVLWLFAPILIGGMALLAVLLK